MSLASRSFHLPDDEILTHLSSVSPQPNGWVLRQLSPSTTSQLTCALYSTSCGSPSPRLANPPKIPPGTHLASFSHRPRHLGPHPTRSPRQGPRPSSFRVPRMRQSCQWKRSGLLRKSGPWGASGSWTQRPCGGLSHRSPHLPRSLLATQSRLPRHPTVFTPSQHLLGSSHLPSPHRSRPHLRCGPAPLAPPPGRHHRPQPLFYGVSGFSQNLCAWETKVGISTSKSNMFDFTSCPFNSGEPSSSAWCQSCGGTR